MTATLLDLSQRPELTAHGRIAAAVSAAVQPLGIRPLIVGATARDLHLLYAHGIETLRQTEDVDFAIAVPNWEAYELLRQQLIRSGAFRASPAAHHRLRHESDLPVDLVPFGGIETRSRSIAWPPDGAVRMDALGFREAMATSEQILLPGPTPAYVASLPGLAMLKLVSWNDRHFEHPRKDAHDLHAIAKHYLAAGNESRLWDEFLDWTQERGFDYEIASARMLGVDMRALVDHAGAEKLGILLAEQADDSTPGQLPSEMLPNDPDRARALLNALATGLIDGEGPSYQQVPR